MTFNLKSKLITCLGVDAGTMSFFTTDRAFKNNTKGLELIKMVKTHKHGLYNIYIRKQDGEYGQRTKSMHIIHKDHAFGIPDDFIFLFEMTIDKQMVISDPCYIKDDIGDLKVD